MGLTQSGSWTVGLLTNHIWSFAGVDSRKEISSTFIQPFLSYITKTKTTFTINTESTYDWTTDRWSAPVNFTLSQLMEIDNQPIQFTIGPRYWADSPDVGPEGWGVRAAFTLSFPQ